MGEKNGEEALAHVCHAHLELVLLSAREAWNPKGKTLEAKGNVAGYDDINIAG